MRQKLTPGLYRQSLFAGLRRDRTIYWDTEVKAFGLVVTKGGHRGYVVQYRVGRHSRRMHLKGGPSVLNLMDARREAKAFLGAAAKGGDPLADRKKAAFDKANTLFSICEKYLKQAELRSIKSRRAVLERLVYPKLGKLPIDAIRRSDIARLLDQIKDERGAPMADHTLAVIRRILSWHASQSDDFRSPIVRGMAKTKPQERARDRTLNDDELRAVWRTAEELGTPIRSHVAAYPADGRQRGGPNAPERD